MPEFATAVVLGEPPGLQCPGQGGFGARTSGHKGEDCFSHSRTATAAEITLTGQQYRRQMDFNVCLLSLGFKFMPLEVPHKK